jgi:hypothetical protein
MKVGNQKVTEVLITPVTTETTEKTFTQSELDQIIGERLKRER